MKRLFKIAAVVMLSALGGCTDLGLGVVNVLVPSDSYNRTADIAYGSDARQKLDIYVPKGEAAAAPYKRPVVLFFYGGSWKYGERGQYRFVGEALASKGFVVVIADYRLYPTVKFPTFMEDAAGALRWTHDHVTEYGGDAGAVFVMGHSAGGHIAAMLALNTRYADAAGVPPGSVRGLIGLAGPYAFRPEQTDNIRDIFVGTGDIEQTRPINFVGSAPPPMFLGHGADDKTVLPLNTVQLAEKARAVGGVVGVAYYPAMAHIGIMAAIAKPFRSRGPVLDDVAAFILETSADRNRYNASDGADPRPSG